MLVFPLLNIIVECLVLLEMSVPRPQRPSSAQGYFSNYDMSVHSFESGKKKRELLFAEKKKIMDDFRGCKEMKIFIYVPYLAPPVMSPVSSNYPSTRSSSFINNRVMSPVGSSNMSAAGGTNYSKIISALA